MTPDARSQPIARDEPRLAERPRSRERPIEPARRATTAERLDGLTEAAWARAGAHGKRGRDPAEGSLTLDAPHAQDHAARVGRAA
jgi:hypothetical protein